MGDACDQLRKQFLRDVDQNGWMHDISHFRIKEYKGTMSGADRYETKEIIQLLHRQNRPIPNELINGKNKQYDPIIDAQIENDWEIEQLKRMEEEK